MEFTGIGAESLFQLSSEKTAKMESFALRALNTGLEQFSSDQYDQAIVNFKRTISMAPRAESALNAYDYMARAQLTKGDTQGAIDSYTKALKLDPSRDDLHMQLGKIYTTEERFDEARDQYALAFKHNPSAANRYALGQGYMGAGQLDEAIQQFDMLRRQDTQEPYGNFGLGQAYSKKGEYDTAIEYFKNAASIQRDYQEAYSEMGYAYADSGDIEQAQEMVTTLKSLSPTDTALADTLSAYIYEKTTPKMTASYVSNTYSPFLSKLGPGTGVNALNTYLAAAGTERNFAMVFQFNKQMDPASVEDVSNWNIARAQGTGRGDGYNYDMGVSSKEASIASSPISVFYDRTQQTATVLFKVRQNDAANATIDPSHINFTFTGKDSQGMSMDKSADMYSGFSGFA